MCIRDRYEVALGADIGAIAAAHHYVNKVSTGELPFLLTSCCPSWAMLAKKQFPDLIDQVSQELTPMVATARTIKKEHPNARVVFIGPCAAKKLEAMRRSVRSDVDFVVKMCIRDRPYNEYEKTGTGFSFMNYNAHEMLATIRYAERIYYDKKRDWNKIVERGMNQDFSWKNSAKQYEELYDGI